LYFSFLISDIAGAQDLRSARYLDIIIPSADYVF
jgi:hypothetical protein